MKNLKHIVGCVAILSLLYWIGYSNKNSPEELEKFSTISRISLGQSIAKVQYNTFELTETKDGMFILDTIKFKEKNNNYEVYELSDRKINNLEGDILVYMKNDRVEKIEFVSSGVWLGSTSSAGFMSEQFDNEREAWIKDAMSYYDIPRWRENKNLQSYEKNDIVHQYKLERIEAFNVQLGWSLNYVITSEDAIESELQTQKDILEF